MDRKALTGGEKSPTYKVCVNVYSEYFDGNMLRTNILEIGGRCCVALVISSCLKRANKGMARRLICPHSVIWQIFHLIRAGLDWTVSDYCHRGLIFISHSVNAVASHQR